MAEGQNEVSDVIPKEQNDGIEQQKTAEKVGGMNEAIISDSGDHQIEKPISDQQQVMSDSIDKQQTVTENGGHQVNNAEHEHVNNPESASVPQESVKKADITETGNDQQPESEEVEGSTTEDVQNELNNSKPNVLPEQKLMVTGKEGGDEVIRTTSASDENCANIANEVKESNEEQKCSNEEIQNLSEKEQDSEDVFHEVSEDYAAGEAAENGASDTVKNEQSNASKCEYQNEDDSVNDDGDQTDHWVDADEENDQKDAKDSDKKQEGEGGVEDQDYAENEDVVNEENGEDTLDDDEIAGNPAYIPKSPRYYMHDSRVVDEDESAIRSARVSRADGKWKHDKFDERSQAPKSKRELVVRYGFDIRNQEKANDNDGGRPAKTKHDNRSKDDSAVKNGIAPHNINKGNAGGGRGGRGGNAGRTGQVYNEQKGREVHVVRNAISHQQQPQGRSMMYGTSRGRGNNNRGAPVSRGTRHMHPQNDHRGSGDGRVRGAQQRDHPMQSKKVVEHVASRRGRIANFSNNNDSNNVPSNSRHNLPGVGGGGKRYSKQRTVPYSEQQRTLKVSPTVPNAGAPVSEVVTQINVSSLSSLAAAAQQQPHQPPPPRNPVDWQRGPPPPPPSAAFQAPPPIRPQLQAMAPPIQAQLSTIAAATVAPVTPTAYRAPNDTVYFDPNEQIIRSIVPPQPRAKKRLEIVSPAD
uniref:Protein CASC3 n=1 Tax=Syphacia muris TaxID=451379 RepID=A0A0N5A9N2_9BILA